MQLNLTVFFFFLLQLLFFVPGSRNSSPTSSHEDIISLFKMLLQKLNNATSYLLYKVGFKPSVVFNVSVSLFRELPFPLCIYIPPLDELHALFPLGPETIGGLLWTQSPSSSIVLFRHNLLDGIARMLQLIGQHGNSAFMSVSLTEKKGLRMKTMEDSFLSSHDIFLFFLGQICQLSTQLFPVGFSFALNNN